MAASKRTSGKKMKPATAAGLVPATQVTINKEHRFESYAVTAQYVFMFSHVLPATSLRIHKFKQTSLSAALRKSMFFVSKQTHIHFYGRVRCNYIQNHDNLSIPAVIFSIYFTLRRSNKVPKIRIYYCIIYYAFCLNVFRVCALLSDYGAVYIVH